jgi:hypothetical protein
VNRVVLEPLRRPRVGRVVVSASLIAAVAAGDALAQEARQAAWYGFYVGAGAGIGAIS